MSSIDIFPWTENFNTGLPNIDEQHQRLVQLLNLLADRMAHQSEIPALNSIFDELENYAVYHFQTEESIWHDFLPDDAMEAEHKEVHQAFIVAIGKLKNDKNSKPVNNVVEDILSFLTGWLASHILESDRFLAFVVQAIQSGLSVSSAKQQAREKIAGTTQVLIELILSSYAKNVANTLQLMREIARQELAEQNLQRLARALRLLGECNTVLIHAGNEQVLLDAICQLAVNTGGYLMAWVGYAEHNDEKTVRWVAQSGYEDGYLDNIKITWSDTEHGNGPTGTAIKTGLTVVNQDYRSNPMISPWKERAMQRGYQSSIALPLFINHDALGMLSIYSTEPFAFSNEEVILLEELANNLSYGIETLRTRVRNEAAQAALKQESEKNVALLRNASDGIHILDTDGYVLEVSDSFCTLLGYRRAEMIGMHVSQWDTHISKTEISKNIKGFFAQQVRAQFETRNRRKNGTILDVEVSSYPLQLNGKPVLFNSSRDITERKLAEKSLRESEFFIRTITNNIPGMVGYWTKDLICTFANSEYLTWFGRTSEQMQGISIQELLGKKLYRQSEHHILAVLRGENQKFERTMVKPNGETGYIFAQYIAHTVADEIQGFFVLVTDITQVKLAEAELRAATSVVETKDGIINQLKVYSADLNTTLNVLMKNKEKIIYDDKIALTKELEQLVMPFLSKLKKNSRNLNQQAIINVLEGNLQLLIDAYGQTNNFSTAARKLTPKEIQIASMIRQGLSTKEIAATLSLSNSTVNNHRINIRKKLGLDARSANLQSKLLSLQD